MNLMKKLLLFPVFFSWLTLTNCESWLINGPPPEIQEETSGKVVGKVLWDPDGDGVYESAENANVELGEYPPFSRTKTQEEGMYFFQNVPADTYLILAYKWGYNPTIKYSEQTEIPVQEGTTTMVPDLELHPVP